MAAAAHAHPTFVAESMAAVLWSQLRQVQAAVGSLGRGVVLLRGCNALVCSCNRQQQHCP